MFTCMFGFQVYLVSSRVHPGETPASFVFNGFLDFVLSSTDPRAKALRRNFVIKLIPILNPDGVKRGHYRTDSRGVNLNRMYLDPNFDLYPSIYASKSVLCFHHMNNRVDKQAQAAATSLLQSMGTAQSSRSMTSRLTNQNNNGASVSASSASQQAATTRPPNNIKHLNKTINIVSDSRQQQADGASGAPTAAGNAKGDGHSDVKRLGRGMNRLSIRESVQSSYRSSAEVASGGEFDDPTSDDGIGNEGSDDEGTDFTPDFDGQFAHAPHLSDPKLREVPPDESGIAFYVDLHGHASKRGCFIYGNYFEAEESQVQNMLFPKLIAMNTAHFDFTGCNFTERNMYAKDKKDGLSKEGAGRVAIFKALGIIHRYPPIFSNSMCE